MRKNEAKSGASIIIPCYNNGKFVAEAIESAIGQSHKCVQVVVVNDGSSDNSAEVIDRYANRVTVIHQRNAGACAARNAGLEHSKGKWIKFLDADDVLELNCIANQLEQAGGRNVVVFGDCELTDANGVVQCRSTHQATDQLKKTDKASLQTFLASSVNILTPMTLYPRSVLERYGGFNTKVEKGQEHELNLRLYLNGVDYEYHPGVRFQYRQHDSPTRISVSSVKELYFHKFENFRILVRLVEEGARRGDVVRNRQYLGRHAWRIGRRHLQHGKEEEAILFFDEATRLGGQGAVYGTKLYVFLARVTNPLFAERVSSISNSFRGRRA